MLSSAEAESWEFWVGSWELVGVVSMKPKSSELAVSCWLLAFRSLVCGLWFVPNSTKPSRFVGTMSFFGIRTTPRFWSSRTSIILFFLLKSMASLV